MGHVNALVTVAKKAGLDQIRVIPVATSPMKVPIEGPSPEQRLEMTRRAFESYGSQFVIDDREIRRGGISYTIDTVLDLRKTIKAEDLYLIIGADHLDSFHQWKDYKKILIEANLIVTTRPGFDIPTSESEFPGFLNELVAAHDFNFIELKTGRSIQFLRLQDVEVSSSEIRKKSGLLGLWKKFSRLRSNPILEKTNFIHQFERELLIIRNSQSFVQVFFFQKRQ